MSTAATSLASLLAVVAVLMVAGPLPANGAERDLVLLQSPGNPLVSFRFVFHTGSAHDPKGKEGLAALTAMMVTQGGTEELSLREVMEALYPLAAGLSAQTDKEVTTIIGRTHRDHLEDFYRVFRDLVQNPRFAPEDFGRNKTQILNYLEKSLRSANDEELGKQSLEWTMYANHPYRHPVQGTVEGVRALTLEDVKAFYKENYTLANLQMGLAGDLSDAFVTRVVEDFEKALPAGSTHELDLPGPAKSEKLRIVLVERPAADATAISLGFPIDITRSDPDFYPLLVANIYLGDHRSFNGVLMNELRGKRGLNYGDYSYIENFIQDGGSTFPVPNVPRHQQFFSIWIRPVAPANAHFSLRAALWHFRRLVDNGMTEGAFASTRNYLKSYSKLWAQSLDRRLGYQLDSSFYGTGFYIDEIETRLDTMTVEDVNRAVKKHLDTWDFQVTMVVAEAGELAAALKENRVSPITYQTPGTLPEVLEEDKLIERFALPIGSVEVVPVGEFFEK